MMEPRSDQEFRTQIERLTREKTELKSENAILKTKMNELEIKYKLLNKAFKGLADLVKKLGDNLRL